MKFSELQLDPSLSRTINQLKYTECTPIQEQAIPLVLSKKDVAGLAQTGTGKTAAFLVPLIERILRSKSLQRLAAAASSQPHLSGSGGAESISGISGISEEQKKLIEERSFADWRPTSFVLILVPTRELAEQVYENLNSLCQQVASESDGGAGAPQQVRGVSVYGGTGYEKQTAAIRSGVEFVIATPGRLIDLYKDNVVDLKQVRAIVFDEADRMFDMGFKDDMVYILQRVPRERQFLVFSATLNFEVLNTAYQFGSEPVEINISRDQTKAENVKDFIFHVGHNEKPQHLLSLLKKVRPKQAIIFTNFKNNVESLSHFLNDNGVPSVAISSLLAQSQRNKVIEQFKEENHWNVLVATDVAARGLDVQGVDLVVNYELPGDAESYVHRIGRTGRAGAEGVAISLVSDRDIDSLSRIETYLKYKINVDYLEDEFLLKDFKAFSERDGRFGNRLKNISRNSQKSQGAQGFQGSQGFKGFKSDRGAPRDKETTSTHSKDRFAKGKAAHRPFEKSSSTAKGARHESSAASSQNARAHSTRAAKPPNTISTSTHHNTATSVASSRAAKSSQSPSSQSSSSHIGSNRRLSKSHGRGSAAALNKSASSSIGAKIKGFIQKLFS